MERFGKVRGICGARGIRENGTLWAMSALWPREGPQSRWEMLGIKFLDKNSI